MREAVVVAAARSPIGSGLAGTLPAVVEAALARVPALVPDGVYVGTAFGSVPPGFAATAVVNGRCASSMQTTRMAVHAIRAGEGDAYVSAGVDGAPAPGEVFPSAAGDVAERFAISRYERDEFRVRSHLLA